VAAVVHETKQEYDHAAASTAGAPLTAHSAAGEVVLAYVREQVTAPDARYAVKVANRGAVRFDV
jgi:hypothetical protein